MHSSRQWLLHGTLLPKVLWKIAQNWLDQLKLRVSYGSNGNQAINPYQTLDRLHLTNYIWGDGGAGVNGAYLANDGVGNPNLKWETTQSIQRRYRLFILQRPYQR